MENAPIMEDIRTLKRMIKQVLTQVESRTLIGISDHALHKAFLDLIFYLAVTQKKNNNKNNK